MIQRDIVHDVVENGTNGNPQRFYTFLGSKKGVHWWVDLFDAGDQSGFHSPENISKWITHKMANRGDDELMSIKKGQKIKINPVSSKPD